MREYISDVDRKKYELQTPQLNQNLYQSDTIIKQMTTPRVEQRMENPMQQRIEQPMQQRMEQPMQQRIEQPMQQRMEQPMQQRIEQPMQQRMEQPMQQRMEQPMQQRIEQPIQQRMEQSIQQRIEQPIQQMNNQYRQYNYINQKIRTFDTQLVEAQNIKLKFKSIDKFFNIFLKKKLDSRYQFDDKYLMYQKQNYLMNQQYQENIIEYEKCTNDKTITILKIFLNIEESNEWNTSLKDFIETYTMETKNMERIMYKCYSFAEIAWNYGKLEKLIELLSD